MRFFTTLLKFGLVLLGIAGLLALLRRFGRRRAPGGPQADYWTDDFAADAAYDPGFDDEYEAEAEPEAGWENDSGAV